LEIGKVSLDFYFGMKEILLHLKLFMTNYRTASCWVDKGLHRMSRPKGKTTLWAGCPLVYCLTKQDHLKNTQ